MPGYAAIGAIPAPVDLAVISSPAATVAGILEECGQAGVKAAVIISSGFSEMGNKAGEAEIKAIAARHGIRLVGPNCAGIINTSHRLCPTMETLPPPGPVALISQSGALAGVVLGWAARDGLGISKFVSYGNRADVNEVDLLEYLADDDETHVVGVYIETVSDGRGFMAAAAKCAARKPVIVIKAGRGESGQRATLSHTGSLAGSDAVYDTALRQCGAIRVESAEEMFDLCRGFVGIPQGIRGRRVAIVTNSGGPSILAADRAEAVGLDVAEPGPAIRAKLASFLPPHAALKNPIDLTVEGTERGYREALMALLAQAEVKAEVEARPTLTSALTLTSASTPSSPSTSHRPIWTPCRSHAASATRPRPRASLCRQLPARGRDCGRGRLSPGPRRAQFPHTGAGGGGGGADGGVLGMLKRISESANQRINEPAINRHSLIRQFAIPRTRRDGLAARERDRHTAIPVCGRGR